MQRKYSIPITLVSVTTAALVGVSVLQNGTQTINENVSTVTENTTLGYDYEYLLDAQGIGKSMKLVVTLPEKANEEPVGLYTDDFGDRQTFAEESRNGREITYSELPGGTYHFVYTSFEPNAFLEKGSVYAK